MTKKELRREASALLLVFIFFLSANTLFVHSHSLGGGVLVTHSHPFFPGTSHSHCAGEIEAIEAAGSALALMDAPAVVTAAEPYLAFTILSSAPERFRECAAATEAGSRAPPCHVIRF